MFIPPIHCKKPYTASDRARFYSPTAPPAVPCRSLPCSIRQDYREPPRPLIQKYTLEEMHEYNGRTILLAGNKYLLDYGDKALTGPYELRRRGLHPRDHWFGPVPQNPEYIREKQVLTIHSAKIAVTQMPTKDIERETLRPKPIRLIPQYKDLKAKHYQNKGVEFIEEWSS